MWAVGPPRRGQSATVSLVLYPGAALCWACVFFFREDCSALLHHQQQQINSTIINMGLQEDFNKAAEDAVKLPDTTTDADKLILYGLYKQAMVGDVNTARPGIFDLKGKAKWDAWKALEGKSKEEAMQDYITKVTQLQEA